MTSLVLSVSLSHVICFFLKFDQIMKIVEVLGMPPQQMLDRAPKTMSFFEMQGDGTYVPKIKEGRQVCPSSRLFTYVFLCTAALLSFDLILSVHSQTVLVLACPSAC